MSKYKLIFCCSLVVYFLFYLSVYVFPYDYFLSNDNIDYGDIVAVYLFTQYVLFYVVDNLYESMKKEGDSS